MDAATQQHGPGGSGTAGGSTATSDRRPDRSGADIRPGSWAQVEAEAPDLAAAVRRCFAVRRHCTMATLRADGSPRISGTEVQLDSGELWLGSMPGARKARDLQRDGRVAVHSPTVDPPESEESAWAGEAKVAGVAVELPAPDPRDRSHRFRLDLREVVHVRVGTPADHLVVTSWHPGRGVEQHRRA